MPEKECINNYKMAVSVNTEFSLVISSARINTTEAQIREVFGRLNLGELSQVDIKPATSRGYNCLKIFIHYSSTNTENPSAVQFRARLDDIEARQKEGELELTPARIIYGRSREGRDQYWQVYKSKTPAQRLAEQVANTSEFTPRIEM